MTKLFNIINFASVVDWLIKWWLLICLGINIAYAENTLQDISFTALPGNKVQLRLTLATTATTPNTFSTDSPPRLVLDFPDTKLALPSRTIMIGIGSVRSVTAIEAEGRCRVVFYFVRKVTYDIKLNANTVLLNMDNGLNVAAQKTRTQIATVETTPPETKVIEAPSASEPTAQLSTLKTKKSKQDKKVPPLAITAPPAPPVSLVNEPIPIAPTIPVPAPATTEIPIQIATVESGLQNIDFQRGVNGEGQILVTLDNPNTVINLTEKGRNNVIIKVLNTKLPKSLHQKLNVIDFATPVQTITSEPKDNDIHIKVQAAGEYEYVSYQLDKLYTLEFYPLTPERLEQKKKEKKTYTGERLTLNFQDIPVRSLLHLLGDFANSNVVISDAVKGNVTLRLKNVPWDQALDIVLKTKFLGQRKHDNVIYIAPLEDLIKQEQTELEANQKIEELAPLKMELIQLNYAKSEEIAKVFTEDKKNLKQLAVTVAKSTVTNSSTDTISSNNNYGMLSPRGSVTVYAPTNSLIIQDTTEQIEKILTIIAKLDVPQKQILIESRIVIADNNFAKELGVRFGWSGAKNLGSGHEVNIGGGLEGHTEGTGTVNDGTWLADVAGNPFSAGFEEGGVENLMVNLPATNPNGAVNFLIGKIGSYLLQLELSALQNEGRGEIISSPRVIASDNTLATMEQGVEFPSYAESESGGVTINWKKAVLSLDVTPHITDDSRIIMELEVHKDTRHEFADGTGIDTRNVKTKVLIDNGETIILGGVYERARSDTKKSVPLFGDIPVVGNLFKNNSTLDENSELLIFVTPKILQPEAMKTAK